MATANTYPAPPGITQSFTNLGAGGTSANFILEPGMWIISVEFNDLTQNLGGDQVQLVQVTANLGTLANTAVLTAVRSGYYTYVVPPGVLLTFNFTTTNGVANVRATKMQVEIGPS